MATLNSAKKPTSIIEYKKWMYTNDIFEFHDDIAQRNYYEAMTEKMKQSFEGGCFWEKFCEHLKELEEKYRKITRYGLLKKDFFPKLFIKPYESFIDKSFRKNILNNSQWPSPPNGEWITCTNAAEQFSDLIRTNVIVQYLDGVDYVATEIQSLTKCKVDYQANIEGYYAVHIDVPSKFEIPTTTWETNLLDGSVEIQITTELKALIKDLLHKTYEKHRISNSVDYKERGWQWDYRSDEFRLNFLGHVVHNLEANILEIRDKGMGK